MASVRTGSLSSPAIATLVTQDVYVKVNSPVCSQISFMHFANGLSIWTGHGGRIGRPTDISNYINVGHACQLNPTRIIFV